MKTYFLSLTFCFFTTIVLSQEARFGFTVSPSFSIANVDAATNDGMDAVNYTDDTNGNTGIMYGAMVDYDFTGEDRYYLHSGVMMHHTGFEVDYTVNTQQGVVSEQSEVNVNYIEVPLILKLKTDDIGYLRYFGQFGLNNAIKIGQKVESGNRGRALTDAKSFNAGLNVGGGIEYAISQQTSAVGGIYYVNGFSNVFDSDAGSIKQNQLAIRLGVYF